jgi:hypothetical protein
LQESGEDGIKEYGGGSKFKYDILTDFFVNTTRYPHQALQFKKSLPDTL